MNNRWLSVAFIGFLAGFPVNKLHADEGGPASSQAVGGSENVHGKPFEGHERVPGLDLTNDQRIQLKSIQDAQKQAMKPLKRKQRDLAFKLTDQLEDKASDADIKRTLSEIKSTQEALKKEDLRFQTQREAILTPSQEARMVLAHLHKHPRGHRGEWNHEPLEHHPMGDNGLDRAEEPDHHNDEEDL
jgi:Spy/CpxP family protein refolding chaperone